MRQVIKRARFSGEHKTQQITAIIRVLTLLSKLFKKSMVGFVYKRRVSSEYTFL
jgi:hypothetical protein